MSNLIDLKSHSVNTVLNLLLKDRTTDKNIIFATDAYNDIDFTAAITKKLLLSDSLDIRPRISKSLQEQIQRTRKKAEVFTPVWICNKMNNYCDTEWFGRENIFNMEKNHDWIPTAEKIEFPNKKSWKDYVNSKRLEITCGEAPYLVSRYDVSTGNMIPIKKRIGILDRKLRVINENVHTYKSWNQWVYRAFESTYGYEFQGDNLLIARINLLETFCEYTRDRWNVEPTNSSLQHIANIISWNLWQMDGIHGVIPYVGCEQKQENEPYQLNLFEMMEMIEEAEPKTVEKLPETINCKIYDWFNNKAIIYKSIREGKIMKFDFCIGNPPYQDDRKGDSTTAQPVYNDFMEAAYSISKVVELITPARFLFNAGYTSKAWNKKMLNDEHLKVLKYENDAKKIFVNTDIKGGVVITYHDITKKFSPIGVFTMYDELNNIIKKVCPYLKKSDMSHLCFVATKFNKDNVIKDYPEFNNHERRMSSNVLQYSFYHDKKEKDDVLIYGVCNGKRTKKYICSKYVDTSDTNIRKYKIITPKADGNGAFGSSLTKPEILSPNSGFTHTFLGIGSFDDLYSAEATLKYIKTKFVRTLLSVLKITQDLNADKWKYVPLQDFTSSSDIDWSQSISNIDKQLYKKYNLSEEEINFIETNVKEME